MIGNRDLPPNEDEIAQTIFDTLSQLGVLGDPELRDPLRECHQAARAVLALMRGTGKVTTAACYDCGTPYKDDGFADLVVSNEVWKKISPTGDENGLLCPTCLVRRAQKAGITNERAEFRSGPFALSSADGRGAA